MHLFHQLQRKTVFLKELLLLLSHIWKQRGNRWFVGVRLKMRLCDGNSADEQTAESAASNRSRNTERLDMPSFSRHHLPADDDKHIRRVKFCGDIYLLVNQSQELVDLDFSLETSFGKLACTRTHSKGYPPAF